MSRRPADAESIFGEAIGIEAAAGRAAFLDRACANDPQLRKELEKLVADHFRAGSFLEEPAVRPQVALGDVATAPYPVGEQVALGLNPKKRKLCPTRRVDGDFPGCLVVDD